MESKKNKKYELEPKRPMFFGIGMIISLSLALVAFEWRSPVSPIDITQPEAEFTEIYLPPITEIKPPPPPPKALKITPAVIDEPEVHDIPLIDAQVTENDTPEVIIPNDDFGKDEVVDNTPRNFAEVMPSYEGGMQNFYQFIADNIDYPRRAQQMGVEGKVFVQFIVEKDGSLSNIKTIKGIGAGCEEEAIRVMKLVSGFTPAKQGDIRVRLQMVVPINFQLQ